MWIFCCGMYRSASTLQFQLTVQIVERTAVGKQIPWVESKHFPEIYAQYANYTGLKVFKIHICTDFITSELIKKNVKSVYIIRDIRDVYASSIKQRLKTFEQLWGEGFLNKCLDNYKKWTAFPEVLVSRYEKVIVDLPTEVERIAEHLDIPLTSKQCKEIAFEYTIEKQLKRIEEFKKCFCNQVPYIEEGKSIVNYHDSRSLLHINHIDSGKIGRWKEDLSQNQVARIENQVKTWCLENNRKLDEIFFE
ncbi:sulfotransferase domain-containing protein [Microcoleus sp. N3A4]|uniref:sulfotransferase domain-containing protein n=1 Tax=Microcoleus sp. N3A4 TaxID=3055379 RepID=UPI002FD1C3A2